MSEVAKVHARQILDSRGNPTVEVDVELANGSFGRAAVPSGASTGEHEVLELRDGIQDEYLGKGVTNAVDNVNSLISSRIVGRSFETQADLDRDLLELDGTENKSDIGANAILGVSLAYAHAVAQSKKVPLYKYIGELYGNSEFHVPQPMFNIMNGGAHANWATDIQEFMVIVKHSTYAHTLESASEIFHHLEKVLDENGLSTNVGNEGGFAPGFKSNAEAFEYIAKAVERAGFKLGEEVFIALDVAASEFYDAQTETYELKTEGRKLSKQEWRQTLESWLEKYPIVSIEDPFGQDDWQSWADFTQDHKDLQIVGDDLLVTNVKRIEKAIDMNACNTLLVKPNQIGSLSETLMAMKVASAAVWKNVVSHRSGETEDVTIAHIAVGTNAGQIKIGAPSRGERTAKYNELLRIAEDLHHD